MILASQSPRRYELLSDAGFSLEVVPADIDETRLPGENPVDLVLRLAAEKAEAVRTQLSRQPEDGLLVAADTIVWMGGEALGKPTDADDARRMLEELSGRTHLVSTGVCAMALAADGSCAAQTSFVETTEVTFWNLSSAEIDAYVATGEPLDNYENLLRFIRLLTDENGLHISQRNVTVSTCGLVPQMRRLAEEHLAITLALSLHAATDEKRRELMPVALKWRLDELMEACAYYFEQTGRRMTFEYALVGGVNDAMEDAERLTALAKPLSAHINLIPVNPIRERTYRQSARSQIEAFKIKLEKNGINVTIRREMGRDIDGACGQLRRRHIAEERCGLTE